MSIALIDTMRLSIKKNKALVKSRNSLKKKLSAKGVDLIVKKELEFKKVSDEELEEIKAKIRKDAKRDWIMKMIVFSIVAVFTIVLFYYLLNY